MIKSRKLSIFIFSLMLVFASFLFVACGKVNYSKTYLSSTKSYVELFVGAEYSQQVSITIENPVKNMSNVILTPENSNPLVCEVTRNVVSGYTTTYTITGLVGGTASVKFCSEEGGKETEVTVKVREFSEKFANNDNALYLSSTTALNPTDADFEFDETATEKQLEFYFYGNIKTPGLLTKDIFEDSVVQENKFVKATLLHIEITDKDYIIFENQEGQLFTLGSEIFVVGSENTKYGFIPVEKEGEEYSFNTDIASPVEEGEKFDFVAKYQNETNVMICERSFNVLVDIKASQFSHEYGYKVEGKAFDFDDSSSSIKIDSVKNGGIVLIPEYKKENAVYATAYLEVEVSNFSELLTVSARSEDSSVVNSSVLGYKDSADVRTYYIEINCSVSNACQTNYILSFYYQGFENSNDEKVNYQYKIPVTIKNIPSKIVANNDTVGDDGVYTFYNKYPPESLGWKPFTFAVIPEGAEFELIEIDLTNSGLEIKYNNQEYESGIVEITDIYETVLIKGVDDTAELTDGSLDVKLKFNVISEDYIISELKYRIVKGVSELDFQTEKFKTRIFLDLNGGEKVFNDLYADAPFETIKFEHDSFDNVAIFEYDESEPYVEVGAGKYLLNFKILPQAVGEGVYKITLDNGKSTTITIKVVEGLEKVSISSRNENNIVSLMKVDEEEATIYAINKGASPYIDLHVFANNSKNSSAIKSVYIEEISPLIGISNLSSNSQEFDVVLRDTGNGGLTLSVRGEKVEDFVSNPVEKEYRIAIVSYTFIDKLQVYKLKDGFNADYGNNALASYLNVYSNTEIASALEAMVDVSVVNEEGFLFERPSDSNFVGAPFNREFLYWESDVRIYKNGSVVDKMYFVEGGDNVYTISSYGTFDTANLKFTAFSDLQTDIVFKLIAHVKQYQTLYSFTVNVKISVYEEVQGIALQSQVDEFEFSALNKEFSIVARPTNMTATNGEIVALFKGGTIDGGAYSILDNDSINDNKVVSDGKTYIKFTLSEEFLANAIGKTEEMRGELLIVAKDWVDASGNIRNGYAEKAIPITVRFANGTEKNRFTIKDAKDLYAIKDNLSAHYQIKTTIDVSSIVENLPLGDFSGSIVGLNEHAVIMGLNIINGKQNSAGDAYNYGLFNSIEEGAYIEYVQFEGSFNISTTNYANIGLIAGENHGKLINVGVTISSSNINFKQGRFGGLVGRNQGEISQDFTLFEDNDSNTRSVAVPQLAELGRKSYQKMTPKTTVYMTGFVDIRYARPDSDKSVQIGGVVGENAGIIRKIDSKEVKALGYSNYMVYARIKSAPSDLTITTLSKVYVGGLVGESLLNAQVAGGYNTFNDPNVDFDFYKAYKKGGAGEDFEAGNGIVVGGEVWGYGYVGGVVGRMEKIGDASHFAGISTRASVRAQKIGEIPAQMAIIANVETGGNALKDSFAVQAVDEGKTGKEASMVILENGEAKSDYSDINKLGFGIFGNGIGVLRSSGAGINVLTYAISRQKIEMVEGETLYIENTAKNTYYGDFMIVGQDDGKDVVIMQMFFEKGNYQGLSLDAKFGNKMQGEGSKEIYFAYYYQAVSAVDYDVVDIQALLDDHFNRITPASKFYPFEANGEMTFASRNLDIVSIDTTGKMIIKKTGLAQISASSVLNSNEALTFYIYVVNYFNSEFDIEENDKKSSIIYPNPSSSAIAYETVSIKLRGENSATIYARPNYYLSPQSFKQDDHTYYFAVDKNGNANVKGIAFTLATNNQVSVRASVKEFVDKDGNVVDLTGDGLDIEIVGQTIIFRKLDTTQEGTYKLEIVPELQLILTASGGEENYYVEVNKKMTGITVDYKYGALSINNVNFNEVPLYTSNEIVDKITVVSTDKNENQPKYYILGLDKIPLQGTVENNDYALKTAEQHLFKVSFTKKSSYEEGVNLERYVHDFELRVSINRESDMFKNRYEENIYGVYELYIQTDSNAGKCIVVKIDFSKTNITSVVVDNYSSLIDIEATGGLTSTSEYGYPGENGLLTITITPEDCDFDYILIENDESNYNEGNAVAGLSLMARKANPSGESSVFAVGNVKGSVTNKGIRLSHKEIIDLYSEVDDDGNPQYVPFNGVIYVRYNLSSKNVVDGSETKINVRLYKDGNELNNGFATKKLTVKLKNYVAVELDGKEGDPLQAGYHMTYQVARGLRYKLNINSYGFNVDNAEISVDNSNMAVIVEENGNYYIDITNKAINYASNKVDLTISVKQKDGDVVRESSSKTQLVINEYVFNYDIEKEFGADIVMGMADGVIDVQVGTQIEFKLDLFEYFEYDKTNVEVINKIQNFIDSLATRGTWTAYTNLISDDLPNNQMAKDENDDAYKGTGDNKLKKYDIGSASGQNYYFNYNGLNVLPIRTHMPEEKYYYFTFNVKFKKTNNGIWTVDTNTENKQKISTMFVLNVYSSSSEESPIPVYDYGDLIKMQAGGYYILLNDITIPNEVGEDGISLFKPINANFASFDGNGHTINMAGVYNMGNQSSIGLFGYVSEDTTIKNLNVNFTSTANGDDLNTDTGDKAYELAGLRVVRFITTADSFVFGSIASENNGIITNCQVKTDNVSGNDYYISVKADKALNGRGYIGGLVGTNSGYITNCGVSINVKAPFYIAGVVAQNYNKVSACYFKEGRLVNNSQFDQHVAGFAITNSENGQIYSSFVAGKQSNDSLVSKDERSRITSPLSSAGFIYENIGEIRDCYTDIDLSKTSGEMAGFAYKNGGTIRNSFSLSILKSNNTASAGFVKEKTLDAIFANCYYYYKDGEINVSLFDPDAEGVKALSDLGFADVEANFADYSYQSGMGTDAIWFYSEGRSSGTYIDYVATSQKISIEGDEGKVQTNTVYKTQSITFAKNRLELVNPNIKVLSIRNFDYSEFDAETGEVKYHYLDDPSTPNRGTLHNPRLISNAENMESEIIEPAGSSKINMMHYRIISDIDYSGLSNLYNITFAGTLEGNGMKISNISLMSMDKQESAGLFAQIGYSSSKKGVVKNLEISPNEVSFTNTNNVGVLAGTLKYGEIYNVTINPVQGTTGTVSGRNFVGGVVGRAVSYYVIKDVYSHVNVASNYTSDSVAYQEGYNTTANYSYAGGIVGFAGNGKIYNAHSSGISNVLGGRAGFAYGGLGAGADVKYTFVDILPGAQIKAYHYGGYVAGEVGGKLTYAHVSNNQGNATFATTQSVTYAVGGIAGRLNGGTISNALMEQPIRATATDSARAIRNVGGLVGLVDGGLYISNIKDSKIVADIEGANIVGGAVAQVDSALIADGIAVCSNKLSVLGVRENPKLGGIVGYIKEGGYSSLTLKNSYCLADLEINTSTSGIASTAMVGGLIGAPGKAPTLEYCYTTSIITAEVYDSRQTGGTIDFASSSNTDAFKYETHSGMNSVNYKEVYYLGLAGESKYAELKGDFLTFKTKMKTAPIVLHVNNFGTPSSEYSVSTFGTNNMPFTEISFFNLWGNRFKAKVDDDDTADSIEVVYNHTNNTYYQNQSGSVFVQDDNDKDKFKCDSICIRVSTLERLVREGEEDIGEIWRVGEGLPALNFENSFNWINKI